MKNLIYTCIGVLAFLFSSCAEEDFEPTFDKSSTQRYTEQKAAFSKKLVDAEFGWVWQHFPSHGQDYGGINYYVKFDEASNVSVSSEQNDVVNEIEISSYSLKQSSGVYLSFDTYNKIAHKYSTPSAAEYQAKGGEFEFNLLTTSTSQDTINMLGRKTRNKMRLIKLKEPWADYNAKVVAIDKVVDGAKLIGEIDNNLNVGVALIGRRLTFSYTDKDNTLQNIEEAFIVTDKGIMLYEPITINGKTYSEFTFDESKMQLVSVDGGFVLKILVAPIKLTNDTWIMNFSNATFRSDKMFTAFEEAYANNNTRWGEKLEQVMFFGNYRDENAIHFLSTTTAKETYRSAYLLDFAGDEKGDEYLSITAKGGGTNWNYYGHLSPVSNMILANSPYKVEMDDATNPKVAKLISSVDSDVWFVIAKQ